MTEKLVFDEKRRAKSLVDPLDSGIVEIDVRIDDVWVVTPGSRLPRLYGFVVLVSR